MHAPATFRARPSAGCGTTPSPSVSWRPCSPRSPRSACSRPTPAGSTPSRASFWGALRPRGRLALLLLGVGALRARLRHRQRGVPRGRQGRLRPARPRRVSSPTPPPSTSAGPWWSSPSRRSTVVSLLGRFVARVQLRRLRARGRCTQRVVVVGRGGAVLELVGPVRREHYAGLDVVAACVTPATATGSAGVAAVPVGGLDDVVAMAARLGADTIAVTSASETAAQYLRQLSWQLEGTGIELLVAPGLIEVAGPRLHIRPFEGLPLLLGRAAALRGLAAGWSRAASTASVAALALLAARPLLLAIARRGPGRPARARSSTGRSGSGVNGTAVHDAQVPQHGRRRRPAARPAAGRQHLRRRCCSRCATTRGSPRSGAWLRRLSLDELPAAAQRAGRLHVARRPAAAAAGRGRPVRRLGAAAGCW